VKLVRQGLSLSQALEMGIINKTFDEFERLLVSDIINARVARSVGREEIFTA